MNQQLDARCIRRELCEAFPKEKIRVVVTDNRFNLLISNKKLNRHKVMRVVERRYRVAYGAQVRWGKARSVDA